MLLSDYGLGTVLTSLSLAPSLFKPIPNYGTEALAALGTPDSNPQCLPHLDGLVVDCENGSPAAMVAMAVKTDYGSASTTAPPPSKTLTAGKNSESGFNVQDASCTVEPCNVPILSTAAFPPLDESRANIYRYRQQQGVNLGSWQVPCAAICEHSF